MWVGDSHRMCSNVAVVLFVDVCCLIDALLCAWRTSAFELELECNLKPTDFR